MRFNKGLLEPPGVLIGLWWVAAAAVFAAAVALTPMLLPTEEAEAAPVPTSIGPAYADTSLPACADVLILGLRGRGDDFRQVPMGADVKVVADKIASHLRANGYSVLAEGVDYQAGGMAPWDTDATAKQAQQGATYLRGAVARRHRECPHARLIVMGQSQGAAVTHLAAKDIAGQVSAIVVLGDPLHEPNQGYNRQPGQHAGHGALFGKVSAPVPASVAPRMASYCLQDDWVCGNGFFLPWNSAHEQYRNDPHGIATAAAQFALIHVLADLTSRAAPAPAAQPSPSAPSGLTYATIGSGLRIHTGPGTSFPLAPKGHYSASGTRVVVICQTTGSWVAGSSIWDKTPDGYVSDWFVTTPGSGTFAPGIPRCDQPSPGPRHQ